jgi:flagellar protein FlaG
MAILNLAGNFQPTSVANGRELPQTTHGRAPSASKSLVSNQVAAQVKESNEIDTQNNNKVVDSKSQPAKVSQQEVKSQIEELQQFNQNIDRSLQFKVDEELGVTIVRVVDKQTDELIRQFPPEELINLSRRLKELNEQDSGNSGVLLQEKV